MMPSDDNYINYDTNFLGRRYLSKETRLTLSISFPKFLFAASLASAESYLKFDIYRNEILTVGVLCSYVLHPVWNMGKENMVAVSKKYCDVYAVSNFCTKTLRHLIYTGQDFPC